MDLRRWFRRNCIRIVILAVISFVLLYVGHSTLALHFKGQTRTLFIEDRYIERSFATMRRQAAPTKNAHKRSSPLLDKRGIAYDGYPSEGYTRAIKLREQCLARKIRQPLRKVRGSYNLQQNAFYCPLCKVSSTFWTRVFKMMEFNQQGNSLDTPFEVPIEKAPASNQYLDLKSQTLLPAKSSAGDLFRFMVVRNPYGLLFSAFVDKLVGPNTFMWEIFGEPAIALSRKVTDMTCGHDVSFEQFLRYVVHVFKKGKGIDCHVAKFDSCLPCATNYTFIVKMETMKDDALHILARFNQSRTLRVFHERFSELHAVDAIDDSVSGPFSWKTGITKCISWYQALQRIWRKLQIRGLIGNEGFPLNEKETEVISKNNFIDIVTAATHKIKHSDIAWQKKQALIEAYRSVPVDILEEIRHIFAEEFSLFVYDDKPDELFNRNTTFPNYGFLNYSNIAVKLHLS